MGGLQVGPMSGDGRSFRLSLGSVVEDVQASAAGRNDISNEFGALSTNVTQRAAMSVQVGEVFLHRAPGETSEGPVEGQKQTDRFTSVARTTSSSLMQESGHTPKNRHVRSFSPGR